MKLLNEYLSFDYDKPTVGGDGTMILKGIIQRADTVNANGRVYPKDILIRELHNYQKLVDEARAFGELDHAVEPIVTMKNASHRITEIWMEGNVVWGKVQLLDTPCGNIVKAVIKGGGRPGISSRALGDLVESSSGVNVVQDNLHIVCWDFVSEPSTPGAYMMKESKEYTKEEVERLLTKSDRVNRALNSILL
jgi:hypothetical protein